MELQKIGCICSRFSLIPGGYKAHVPREILPGVQNNDHKEGDLWDQETLARHCMNSGRGLMMMDRSMIDVTSEGALMDKTPATARHLISNMASNTQQFGTKGTIAPRMANEVDWICFASLKAKSISTQKEHLGPVDKLESRKHLGPIEAESILAQADFRGQNYSGKNVQQDSQPIQRRPRPRPGPVNRAKPNGTFQVSSHDTLEVACSASHNKGRIGISLCNSVRDVTGGDGLDHQRTPVDLILSVLANEGEPLSSTMVIVVEDGTTEARPCKADMDDGLEWLYQKDLDYGTEYEHSSRSSTRSSLE
ncbi:hypothetical protein CR513_32084, partial [Mucuna pruriens]